MRPKLRLDAVLIQAVIAGALSFAHLHDIAEAAGQHGWKAWAYPISVDLLFVAAWRRLRTLRANDRAARAAWTWFVIALAASLGANIATAGLLDLGAVPAWLRILVAGWPALAFLGGTLLAHTPTAPRTETEEKAEPAPADPITVDRAREAPSAELDPAHDVKPDADDELHELPAAPVPAPAPEPTALPLPTFPPALLDHARKVADTYRSTTGSAIDAETLRTRLGVPVPLANAITAQLA
ncbi:DUF2637 domain-containing protein [Streptomyces decoyicus]|uniref:DUF2637 domain-containing protein n=1 Tax=Streptomyces decoyicus TaxID=249567 RepID=UPI0004ABB9FC|nr:DUF2637 domain-containing protein [Streptomyces decoyicus]KOG48388.1 SpdA protein [Streptomyces decoyicus]QZY15800.1 DUF2637 domain-containing protein [Streptomyces decoyicus]